jgi:hypothetical protein
MSYFEKIFCILSEGKGITKTDCANYHESKTGGKPFCSKRILNCEGCGLYRKKD